MTGSRKRKSTDDLMNEQPVSKKQKDFALLSEEQKALIQYVFIDINLSQWKNKDSFFKKTGESISDILKIGGHYFLVLLQHSLGQRVYEKTDMTKSTVDIYLAQDFEDNLYVVKKYQHSDNNPALLAQIARDNEVQKKLGYFIGDWHDDEEKNTYYVVKKYIFGQPLDKIKLSDLNKQIDIALKTTDALIGLHKKSLLHCDIKPENIIYDEKTDTVTFIDFGISLDIKDISKKEAQTTEWDGTQSFVAPEVAKNNKDGLFIYNEKTEVYSLGIALTEWFQVKNYLFPPANQSGLFNTPPSKDLQPIIKLLREMIAENPDNRPTLLHVRKQLQKLQPNVQVKLEHP